MVGRVDVIRDTLLNARVTVAPVDTQLAEIAAALSASTRKAGTSVGDRLYVALAMREGVGVLTADRRWREAELPVDVVHIR